MFEDTLNWIENDIELSASVIYSKEHTKIYWEDDYPHLGVSDPGFPGIFSGLPLHERRKLFFHFKNLFFKFFSTAFSGISATFSSISPCFFSLCIHTFFCTSFFQPFCASFFSLFFKLF